MDLRDRVLVAMGVALLTLALAVVWLLYQGQRENDSAWDDGGGNWWGGNGSSNAVESNDVWGDLQGGNDFDELEREQQEHLQEQEAQLDEINEVQKRMECEMKKARGEVGYQYRNCDIYPGP